MRPAPRHCERCGSPARLIGHGASLYELGVSAIVHFVCSNKRCLHQQAELHNRDGVAFNPWARRSELNAIHARSRKVEEKPKPGPRLFEFRQAQQEPIPSKQVTALRGGV